MKKIGLFIFALAFSASFNVAQADEDIGACVDTCRFKYSDCIGKGYINPAICSYRQSVCVNACVGEVYGQ